MTTHVCSAVELLTRAIREEGGDGKRERRGGGEGGERRRRCRVGGRGEVRGELGVRSEEERCGDVVVEVRGEVRRARRGGREMEEG